MKDCRSGSSLLGEGDAGTKKKREEKEEEKKETEEEKEGEGKGNRRRGRRGVMMLTSRREKREDEKI